MLILTISTMTNLTMNNTTSLINVLGLVLVLALVSCTSEQASEQSTAAEESRALFKPEDGKVILFVGQELEAIGGLEEWNDGYLDYFERPGGFTMYTKLRPGDEEFGFTYTGLSGLNSTDDWGDSPSNMSLQLADPDFANMALAIGFEMVNHEAAIAQGERDSLVFAFGNWLKSLGERPVFLRIGYEFAGEWNHYNREDYIAAYRYMKDKYDSMGVNNVAYVWQSHGWDEPMDHLESWYPGDDYVDWCGYSFFSRGDEANMIEFARQKGKPVFIAEATPTISTATVKTNGKTKETILSEQEQAEEAWEKWFTPFFNTVHDNADVVKAINYINCHWKSHPMWVNNPTFQDVDARLQTNEWIMQKWNEEIGSGRYIMASEELYKVLGN